MYRIIYCGLIRHSIPVNEMYSSVKQCARNSLFKNHFTYYLRLNIPMKSHTNCEVVKLSERHFSYLRSQLFCKSPLTSSVALSQKTDLFWSNKNHYCTKQASDSEGDKKIDAEQKLTTVQRLKKLWKDYWYILFPVHAITSAFWYGSFYYMVASGLDIPELLSSFGAPESWSETLRNSQAGNFVLAYALYKVATPVRYTVTIGGTTLTVKFLRNRGWIQSAPATQQIKDICKNQKEAFKELKATYQDKMQVTKDEFLKSKKAMTQQFLEVQDGLHKSIRETRDEFKNVAEDYKYVGKLLVKQMKESRNPCDDNK